MTTSNRPDLHRFLDRLTSRSVLTADEQQVILNLPCRIEHIQANRDIVALGQRVDSACLIVAGLVGRFDQNSDGKRQITALHIPGDMADLHSLVQSTPPLPLQALSMATIARVPHAALRGLAAHHPAIAEAFWRDCMVDSTILSQWVVNLGRRDARQRIAHLLCEMATRMQAVPTEGCIIFPFAITQTQLADATGLTPVHVNRSLKSLREANLAEVCGKTVRISSFDRLADFGDFDAGYLQADGRPEQRMRLAEAD